jgi:hypothetical protein
MVLPVLIARPDLKMIDHLRFSGRAGGFSQRFMVNDHIDQRRFTNITPPEKRKLGSVGFRTRGYIRAGNKI